MEQNDTLPGQGVAPESTTTAEENNNNNNNMEALLDQEGMSLDFPQPGEIRTGVVASISPSQILVSVGAKSEGVITGRELEAIPAEERAALAVGQEILVYVLSAEDNSGNVVLSYTRAQEQKGWAEVEKLLEDGGSYDGKVDGFNKGGIIVPVYGLRGFVPASQLGISLCQDDRRADHGARDRSGPQTPAADPFGACCLERDPPVDQRARDRIAEGRRSVQRQGHQPGGIWGICEC
jgi:small subunit ribosomal protein S1